MNIVLRAPNLAQHTVCGPIGQVSVSLHAKSLTLFCSGDSNHAIILVEDASGPGWGPPPREGATVFQATFNMVSLCWSLLLLLY